LSRGVRTQSPRERQRPNTITIDAVSSRRGTPAHTLRRRPRHPEVMTSFERVLQRRITYDE
jgi:hypothetical protein